MFSLLYDAEQKTREILRVIFVTVMLHKPKASKIWDEMNEKNISILYKSFERGVLQIHRPSSSRFPLTPTTDQLQSTSAISKVRDTESY